MDFEYLEEIVPYTEEDFNKAMAIMDGMTDSQRNDLADALGVPVKYLFPVRDETEREYIKRKMVGAEPIW